MNIHGILVHQMWHIFSRLVVSRKAAPHVINDLPLCVTFLMIFLGLSYLRQTRSNPFYIWSSSVPPFSERSTSRSLRTTPWVFLDSHGSKSLIPLCIVFLSDERLRAKFSQSCSPYAASSWINLRTSILVYALVFPSRPVHCTERNCWRSYRLSAWPLWQYQSSEVLLNGKQPDHCSNISQLRSC